MAVGLLMSIAPAAAQCTGDCDGGGSVSIDELITAVDIAEPSGEEIFFANPSSANGGRLDLDARCDSDIRNENIAWSTGRAPRGHYVVRAEYFNSCDATATDYVATVRRAGLPADTFSGTFTGAGTFTGEGGGETITEFDL